MRPIDEVVAMFGHGPALNERLLASQKPDYGVLPCGWLPLDVDTFAMNNGGTAKEGVGRTYAGVDCHCPLAAYRGSRGLGLELALRLGVRHSAREIDINLEPVIAQAQRFSAAGPKAPFLAWVDSGFDSAAPMRSVEAFNESGQPQGDWLIKWNPRSVDIAAALAPLELDPGTCWQQPRAGKRVVVRKEPITVKGISRAPRRVLRRVEREIDRRGQQLIVPEVELEGWTTSLNAQDFDAQKIMALYADHGPRERFHSEFETDLGDEYASSHAR